MSLLISILLEVLANEVRHRTEIKDLQMGKDEVKLSFNDDIILYVEISKV